MIPLRYGMFVQPGMVAAKGEGHQFGMYASCQGGSQALLRHSRAEDVRFVCSPFALDAIKKEAVGTRARVEDLVEFLRRGQDGTRAWIDMAGDVVRPFRFRRGNYPIGVVQHSVSYGYALHSWFLPLLLGDVRAHDTVLCTSTAARESIRKILDHVAEDMNAEHGTHLKYRGRLDVIPAGVDVDHFKPVSKPEARKAFGIPVGDEVVLFAGRISAQDKADLIPFLKMLAGRPNLRLVLAGAARGDEMQVLGKAAAELGIMSRITALGLVSHALLPKLYSATDVFVSPADNLPETFGLTCVEAMACGVPVVASDWNGYKDTVVHGETGFLVPTWMSEDLSLADGLSEWSTPQGDLVDVYAAAQATVVDMEAMRVTIANLLDLPDLRARMGAAGRRRAVERYAWPVVVRMYDDLFDGLRAIPAMSAIGLHPYSRTRLAKAFSYYPTGMFTDETVVRAVLGSGGAPFLVRNPRPQLGVVRVDVAQAVYDVLAHGGSKSIGKIVDADLGVDVEEAEVRFHVVWLLKHGYLQKACVPTTGAV